MADKLDANVLLVDDEEQFLQVLSERLTNRGLHVISVTSGEEAVAQVENNNFDAIVVDLAMPGINGIETMKKIKEKRSDLEIIILTGHATVKTGIEAMKLGAEDFLEKPVDLNVLLEKIRNAKHKRMLVLEKKSQNEMQQILKTKSW
jgi:DNA-binding NtrC family response regulator